MSARDTQPTEPLPEALMIPGDPEPRRRRVWPWIVAFAIVVGLAVAAWFAADAIARQLITGAVREGVRSQLSLPATALGCANRVITELGVFDTAGDCFICVVRADGVNQQVIEQSTAARVLFTTITAGRG